MENFIIDYSIVNSEEKKEVKNIIALKKNNYLLFEYENDKYKLKISENYIILEKENDSSLIKFHFKKNSITDVYYLIKDMSYEVPAKIETLNLLNIDKNILIEYKLFIADEEIDKFKYKLKIREVNQ